MEKQIKNSLEGQKLLKGNTKNSGKATKKIDDAAEVLDITQMKAENGKLKKELEIVKKDALAMKSQAESTAKAFDELLERYANLEAETPASKREGKKDS
eukprot:UC4_evm2s751